MKALDVFSRVLYTILALPVLLAFTILMIPFEIVFLFFDFAISTINYIWEE